MTSGNDPVKWWCWDSACDPLAPGDVPGPEWDGWEARYDNDCELGKRTTRQIDRLPPGIGRLLAGLTDSRTTGFWSERLGYPVIADPTMHGGGLHVMSPCAHLCCHLDYDRHPKLPDLRRALNIIAFLHPHWSRGWGGQLYLADPLGQPMHIFDPIPGRVVAFEVGDLSYHGVLPLAANAAERVTLAVYLLANATASNTRRRALFMPRR